MKTKSYYTTLHFIACKVVKLTTFPTTFSDAM